jgi:hypothetical protein
MEVNVLATDKLPEDYLLSIRAGTVRRQATLASNRPFRFPKITMEESPLKIDVLQQIATAYVVLKPNEDQYKVLFQGPGGVPSTLSCEVEVKKSDGDHGSKKDDDAVATKDATNGAKEAKDYLEEHQLLKFVQAALQAVIKERPKKSLRTHGSALYEWLRRGRIAGTQKAGARQSASTRSKT